jgi:hypothetical protein
LDPSSYPVKVLEILIPTRHYFWHIGTGGVGPHPSFGVRHYLRTGNRSREVRPRRRWWDMQHLERSCRIDSAHCSGAHSWVRKTLGFTMDGEQTGQLWRQF